MFCVSSWGTAGLRTKFVLARRFGGGSELLSEGDSNNVWAVLEKGMA